MMKILKPAAKVMFIPLILFRAKFRDKNNALLEVKTSLIWLSLLNFCSRTCVSSDMG